MNYSEDWLLSADFEALLADGLWRLGEAEVASAQVEESYRVALMGFERWRTWLMDLRFKRTLAGEKAQRRDEEGK